MCMPVRVKNVPPNCGTDGAQGFVNGVMPSWISLLHSMPCSRTKAAPKNMVANNQLRVRILSPRWAANTPNTMVSELDSRQAVMMVALMMLSLPKRSEEHTSELQSRFDLVCRLLLEKKKKKFEVH